MQVNDLPYVLSGQARTYKMLWLTQQPPVDQDQFHCEDRGHYQSRVHDTVAVPGLAGQSDHAKLRLTSGRT